MMMKRNKRLARLIALVLALLLLLTLIVPALAAGGGATITIRDADDLLSLSRNCTLDTWSQGKTVVLQADISLDGVDFTPIPTFGGTFNGRGHTISGLTITGSTAPAGLFGILQESAVVKDLTVSGNIVPAGNADTVGGIAGLNYGRLTGCAFQGFVSGSSRVGGVVGLNETTGQLINCSFQGAVTGEHYVGGITGWNAGSLIQCVNNGSINTTVINVKAEFSGLDLQQLRSTESVPAGTDIGGIAGFSTGLLQSCKNTGDVGYEHMGYNVGGIVGRQSGYLDGCVNSGTVRGRKDVGGIAGQLEPQVVLKYNEDTLSSLWDELDVLEELMDRALSDAEGASDAISGSMSSLTESVGAAKDTAVDLTDAMTEWANGNIDQINDASARLSWVLDQMGPIMDDLGDALEQAEIASGQFSDALDDAELAAKWGNEAVAALDDALTDLQNASADGRNAYNHVKSAMTHLENSLGDEEETKEALDELADATADMADAFSRIAGSMANIGVALDKAYDWVQNDQAWKDLREGVSELWDALTEISAALEQVSSAIKRIVEIGDTEENRTLLREAMDALMAATDDLNDAYQAFSDALDAYEEGDMDGALDKLDEGIDALGAANSEVQTALNNIRTIIDNIENAEGFDEAVEDLQNGLSDLNDGIAHANAAVQKINDALDELEQSEVPEETEEVLQEELPKIRDALRDVEDASGRISAALEVLEENFSASEVEAAWTELQNAADDAELAADDLDRAVGNLKLALEYLEKAGGYGSDAMADLNKASETMGKAISLLRQATEKAADVINELAEKPAIQFTPISSDLTERGDALDDALSQMLDQVDALNDTMSSSSDILLADLRAINRQVGVIIDLLRQASEEAKEEDASDHFEDVSDRELFGDMTSGRISASRNEGTVEGDINVAGIVGSIAIEYDFDPEDDLTKEGSRSLDYRYQTAAVVWDSTNEGVITSKKDYAGGIVGRMDLGTVSACRGYGRVESTGGDYVGGIAGLTSGTIRGCFTKCVLEGDRYVGGIVGSGTAETAGGSASTVSGCYSMVSIPRYDQYAGAISGVNTGAFLGNYFVSDTLAGINGASYSGRAEPIAYADLPWDDTAIAIPDAFRQLTLEFVVDGETVKALSFDYGQSFDRDVYPELPEKDGYYAYWDLAELQELHFDTVVTAVYERHISALSSEEKRSDDHPIFFAEGQFDEEAVLTVTAQANTPADFDLVTGYKNFVVRCFSDARVSRTVVEQWSLTIPEDGLDTHTVRYLSPDGDPDHLDIYVKEDGTWKRVETQAVGSYLTFPVSGSHVEIAALSTLSVWWVWLIAAAVLLLVLILIIRLVRRIRRRRKTRRVSTVPPGPKAQSVEEEESLYAYAGTTQAYSAQMEDDTEELLYAHIAPDGGEMQESGFREEEEGPHLYAVSSGAHLPPPPPSSDDKRKKKRWPLLVTVLVLAGAAAGIILSPLGPKLKNNLEAYVLLRQYTQQQELSMGLSVQGQLDGQAVELSAQVDWTQAEGHRVTCVSQGDARLYYADGVVFLENGKAYQLTGDFPDYSQLLDLVLPLYQRADISSSKSDGKTTYTVTAKQENARELLALLLPSVSDQLSGLDTVTAELTAEGGAVSELRFFSSGTLNDSGQTPFSVSAVLQPQRREPASLPGSVRAAICGGSYEATDVLTGDLLRLASAWAELNGRDSLSASLYLRADCGPLSLSDELELYRWTQDDLPISCIRKNGRALYFTDTTICGANGESVPAADEAMVDSARLLEIAYQFCLNADLDCRASGAAYTYTLSLDEEGMEDVVRAIAPAAAEMDLLIDAGTLRIVVRENVIQSVRFSCTGSAQVLLANVAAAFEAELRFPDGTVDVTVPDAVRQALA